MHKTPWSKQNSSLPSDRIKSSLNTPNNSSNLKGKGKQQSPPDQPKSKDVRRLEAVIQGVKSSTGKEKDPKGGCFCLGSSFSSSSYQCTDLIIKPRLDPTIVVILAARSHSLSSYTPICYSCGLILCSVNLPQYSCPHCANVLLTSSVREPLINRLESELAETVAKELEELERAIEQSRKEAGSFPQLSAATTAFPGISPPAPASVAPPSRQTHKVMSLTSGNNRRVVVSSYTTTPVPSRPVSRNEDKTVEDEVHRVPPPSIEPTYSERRTKPERPWENLLHGAATYKPPTRLDDDGSTNGQSRRRRNKGKGKETEASTQNQNTGTNR